MILASDATRLSQFGGDKITWPVYLSIGNVDKSVRCQPTKRATVLLGYLPTSKLECFAESERGEQKHISFHYAMSRILAPLREAGLKGVEMTCADGYVRRVHPIIAAYVADFPEQCLIACCKESRCPRCKVTSKQRGDFGSSDPRRQPDILETLATEVRGQPSSAKKDGVQTHSLALFGQIFPTSTSLHESPQIFYTSSIKGFSKTIFLIGALCLQVLRN